MKHILFIALILLFATSMGFSQTAGLSFHMYTVVSQPTGDFARNIADNTGMTEQHGFWVGDKIGLAKTGFGAGVELMSPVWFKWLQWVFSSMVVMNTVDGSAVGAKFRSQLGDSVIAKFDYGLWINMPIMTGFRYDHNFTAKYTAYAIIQSGVNFSMAPSKKAIVNGVVAEESKYSFARDFGYQVGVGFMYNQRYNLSMRYLFLGTPRYDGKRRLSEKVFPHIFSRENDILGEQRSISMIVVTLGIQFFQ